MNQEEKIRQIDQTIIDYYSKKAVSDSLVESILYSVQAGGKRIRPLLLLELVEAFGLPLQSAHFQVASALEMIHTGSLIHDDLPAMDDDDYRRGRLTNHKKFGEAMAILAGDSLFLDPYGLIAVAELPSQVKVNLIMELSQAAGTFGMVGGQALDMEGEGCQLDLKELQAIHAHKTGKLLAFPFVAAGLLVQVEEGVQAKLRKIGELIGLAFQVRDDILDVTASFEELGKTPQKDLVAAKSTYPALLGLEKAKETLDQVLDQAQNLLKEIAQNRPFSGESLMKIIESLRLYD
ncbi:Farnesyl diphosphate synthase [Streptococcus gordonii]|jgi:geranyltranstransferase|uniref:polyprenyl synthetase family protein n=1 Tax=Streptococcus gordonii TaxID=1302 RepID=UPI000F66A8D3|nr:farnesyl diphosphate synthase [Streptococcus gordonii]RSJ41097.1 Farnesyl diphosphate synthase [Streptococcus gordonii]